MKVSLPEGYVPPQPTHPHYGYLTPAEQEEQEELEARERERLGIVPVVEEPGAPATEAAVEEAARSTWAPVAPPSQSEAVEETQQWRPSWATAPTAERAGQSTGGWVPSSPPVAPVRTAQAPPAAPPALVAEPEPRAPTSVLGQIGEYRWDAYRQEWVSEPRRAARAAEPPPAARAEPEEPPPDVAAAAGGRGASSSWTSADGQRFRWDARAQRWIVEGG